MTTNRDHAALRAAATSDWVDAGGRVIDEDDRGLLYDLTTLGRRQMLGLFGGVGAMAALAACSADTSTRSTSSATSATSELDGSDSSGGLSETPDETGGPFPADGTNGPDVLTESGIVRSDIRSSYGTSTTTAAGVPLTFSPSIRDATTGNAKAGAAVYAWHCDRDGNYSLYSQSIRSENYLRGVQEADSSGIVTFTSIFPACYSGRWPHIHFEVYSSLADATSSGRW